MLYRKLWQENVGGRFWQGNASDITISATKIQVRDNFKYFGVSEDKNLN